MGNPVVHFEINTKNPGRLRSFYSEIFGWKMNSMPGPMEYAMVETGAQKGIAGGIGKAQQGEGNVTFYIEVEDLPAYLKKVERAGGKTIVPVTEVPNVVTFALFADPEGHHVGLVKS